MKLLITFLVLVVAFCGFLAVDRMRINAKRRKLLQARLASETSSYGENEYDPNSAGLNGEPSEKAKAYLKLMRNMGINVEESIRNLELRFARAGINSVDAPIYYLFYQRVVSFGLATFGLFLLLTASGEMALFFQMTGGLILFLAVFGASLYLKNKTDHRNKVLQRAFPDTLDLLLICVESGLALDAALNRVCSELNRAYPEMTEELNRTRLELSLLNDRVRALMNLGDRTGMVAFRSLVVALIQSERFGTSLTDTLRVLSEDFRLQRLANAEAKAARLPVLLTIPLIFLLMPAFLMIVMGPAIIGIMRSDVTP